MQQGSLKISNCQQFSLKQPFLKCGVPENEAKKALVRRSQPIATCCWLLTGTYFCGYRTPWSQHREIKLELGWVLVPCWRALSA